jgi:hypothetical protein
MVRAEHCERCNAHLRGFQEQESAGGFGGSQATEDRNRNLNKRVRFYWNRNLEERVKFRCQVARPQQPRNSERSGLFPK